MKTLANLNVPKDTTAKFPHGTIQNETSTQEGTPVVRELYGDILTNIYKILDLTKEVATGDEDSDDTQYQLVNALRKFHNVLNDIEQVITLVGTVWTIGLDLSILPNKYVFFGRATENYDPNVNYQFKGSNSTLLGAVSPTGFKLNDEVLTVIDTAGVRIYSLTQLTQDTSVTTFNVLGSPLSFNDTNTMYYLESGKIYTDAPKIYDVTATIRTEAANVNLMVSDAVVFAGKLFCLVYDFAAISYRVFTFDLGDLTQPTECVYNGFNIPTGTDHGVYFYCDGVNLYFTNEFNNSAVDESINKYVYVALDNSLALLSTIPLPNTFEKTTNSVISGNKIYTFINETLKSYDLNTFAVVTVFDNYTLYVGVIFSFDGSVYFSHDEVAAKWIL